MKELKENPLVTVLMPVYNGEVYLKEAIESVLNQTYINFEFLIINDGSTDSSAEIINSYKDSRIRFVNNDKNLKLIATLNKGLKLANGKYIARFDCDDVCFPNRLDEQVKFMEANPEIGISGSYWARNVSREAYKPPLDHEAIKIHLFKGSAILHPTAIFRKEFFDNYNLSFDPDYIHAEDYDLWVKASRFFTLANVPKELIVYRTHQKQITREFSNVQREISIKILNNQLEFLGIHCTKETVEILYNFFNKSLFSNQQLKIIFQYIPIIIKANEKKNYYDAKKLNNFLHERVNELWDRCLTYNFYTFYLYHKSQFLIKPDFTLILYLKLIKRAFVNIFTKNNMKPSHN